MRQFSATKKVKRSKQDRAIAEIKHHAHSKENASKKVLYTKQPLCKVTQGNKIHISESQRTSSKPATISTHPALCLNIDHQQQPSVNISGSVKKNKIDHIINWEILDKALPYSASTGRCNLCIAKRINILYKRPTLNKRRELFCTCPHRRKCLLQKNEMEPERNTRRMLTTETRQHLQMAELARNRFVVKVGKDI